MKLYKSFTDLGAAFKTIKSEMFLTYRGNLLERIPTGYRMGSRDFLSLEEVDLYLKELFLKWNKNIK